MPKYRGPERRTHGNGVETAQRLVRLEVLVDSHKSEQDKALLLANTILDERLKHLNEWREQNKDERSLLMSRLEYDANHKLIENKISQLERLVYMGVGIVLVIEFVFRFLIK